MLSVVETGIASSKNPASGALHAGPLLFTTLVPKDPATGVIVETEGNGN